uniref:DUF6598 domain-containing protein n=1 Tax=Oryza nivara TaxID=4536 RepID=A0A0E0FNT5_ORYNI
MASSPEKKDPPSCGSRDSQPIPCTDDPPLSESPTTDLGCHDPRDEDADHPAPPMGKGDIDEDSDDDGYADEETTCPGQNFTKEQAKEIIRKWLETYDERNREFMVACEEFQKQGGDETSASCPVFPLKPLPETTDFCTPKSLCYHREYKTNDTSETASTIGWLEPKEMLQIFSLRLSSSMSYPISVYGIFAVRDYLDPLRNYVFNRTRDDPVIVEQDSFTLPLCSPCRGMYVVEYALFEVDLWVKMEGGVSNDKQLLSAYVEIFARGVFNKEMSGRILSDHCHVKFTAFCSGFDNEILLFNGKLCKDKSFQHIVAMKSKGKLVVHLEFEGSLFCWTFNNGRDFSGPVERSCRIGVPCIPPHREDSDDIFASTNSDNMNMLIGDIDEDSDDDGYVDEETTCPGQNFTKEQEKEIMRKWLETYDKKNREFMVACEEFQKQPGDETSASRPVFPFKPLPETTDFCITKSLCYHREYKTNDTSETASTIGWREPKEMLQIFSLRLSSSLSYPISVYGIFAVRDYLDPLRNYVFNRTRDDPVIVEQDPFTLPLCSPCRGMYVIEYALFEVDLWVKMEGGVSNDKRLLSAYVEIFARGVFNKEMSGRILSDHCYLDTHYMYLSRSIEAVIQVSTEIDSNDPRHVKFTAFCSGFDNEILLFNGKLCKDKSFEHIVAMKSKGKLVVRLEFEGSLFCWTFNDGDLGAVNSPDDSVLKQFHVRVVFSPKQCVPPTYNSFFLWRRSKSVQKA